MLITDSAHRASHPTATTSTNQDPIISSGHINNQPLTLSIIAIQITVYSPHRCPRFATFKDFGAY